MSKEELAKLEVLLTDATADLKKVSSRKMFGCHALWVNENVFALVWKHGRICVKLPEDRTYQALMGISGAEPWKAGPKQMAHWVLVPESFHKKPSEVRKWASRAHLQCAKLEKKPKKKAK